jgi:cold shock CspA family protein
MSDTIATQSARILGQVKWFNNKAGYGFITVNDGEQSGKDIFVHYSTIRVSNQYKYLVQGEYVEFEMIVSTTDGHEFQANDVSGIKGGPLMCETRRTARPPLPEGAESRPPRRYRTEESKPASSGEFTTVRRKKPTAPKSGSA